MKCLTIAALVFFSAVGLHAQTKADPANPKIYVDAATGFEAYLSAAAAHNRLAITFTTQKNEADYAFDAISGGETVPGSDWSLLWTRGNGKPWIRLVNLKNSSLVFACAVTGGAGHGLQGAADSCVRRLRDAVNPSAQPFPSSFKSFFAGAPEWNF